MDQKKSSFLERVQKSKSNPNLNTTTTTTNEDDTNTTKQIDYNSPEYELKLMLHYFSANSTQVLIDIIRDIEDTVKKEKKEDELTKKAEARQTHEGFLRRNPL